MDDAAKYSVLVVDDTEANIDILVETLDSDYDVSAALDGETALEIAEADRPDIILLDIMMPEMDGYEVCRRLKAGQRTKDIPVVFVTAMGEVEDETRGFELGAVDYITKPISPPIVKSRIRSILTLKEKTEQLASLSTELSKYLSPQVYESIFSGQRHAQIESQRKKLTVFFSDIVGFTETTERMEAEEISSLLNLYLDAMATIAIKHGGTIDKFVGDAVMVFFGDPQSKGVKEDALACVSMALEMIESLKEIQKEWYEKGVLHPFRIRVGIHTGYCTVGNFGSKSKMDYTIIGGQVNAAKRLQEIAPEDRIVISHETWSQVHNSFYCIKNRPVLVKGIANPIQTYQVIGRHDTIQTSERTFPIGVLGEKAETTSPDTLLKDVSLARRLDDTLDGIVVVQGNEPIGLLMHYHLIRILNAQSHRDRFLEQPVSAVMDASPLVVENNTPLEEVVHQVMSRDKDKPYDHVVVTGKGDLLGVVPIKAMFEKLAELCEEKK